MTGWNPGADPLADIQKVAEQMVEQKGILPMPMARLRLGDYGQYALTSIGTDTFHQLDGPIAASFYTKEPIAIWNTHQSTEEIQCDIKLDGYIFHCTARLVAVNSPTKYDVELLVKSYEKIDYLKEWSKHERD